MSDKPADPPPLPPSILWTAKWLPFAVCGMFVLVGSILSYGLGAPDLLEAWRAAGWTEVPVTIVSSELVTTEAGTRVAVVYDYEVDGRSYRSDRYQFVGMPSTEASRQRKTIEALVPGTETTGWVDPGVPERAVLVRELAPEARWLALPLGMFLVGIVGLLLLLWLRRRSVSPVLPPGRSTR